MPKETPVLSPVRLIELRSFAHWSSSYLQRVLDTTYVPEPERLERVVRPRITRQSVQSATGNQTERY